MVNLKSESKIRDWLADNLNFIENGLILISKEFHLPDNVGAKGFVDLLCKDVYNNFVIIEIKRSNTSARHTITEILKYHSLIKHNFKARESEIRIIVLSTHWEELIRAYSETFHKTNIALKGFQIEIDNNGIPYSINQVEPLSHISIARKFAYWQGLYLFKTTDKRKVFHEKLNQKLSVIPIEDFVLLDLDGPLENKKVITPYAVVAVFQKQSVQQILQAIKKLNTETDVMNREDFDDEPSYQKHLEGAFIDSLDMFAYDDDAEAGYSEKLDSMINNQDWTVKQIKRYGIFKTDPRYTDDLLLSELRGHDGNSRNKFIGFAESTQLERINEIKRECMNSLVHTPQWAEFIKSLFDDLKQLNEKFRLVIDIYNHDSIINSFFFAMTNANPGYLPIYKIFVDYFDSSKTDIYIGELYWNTKIPTAKLFISADDREIVDEVFRLHIEPDNEIDSTEMALIYTNRKIVIINNHEIFNDFVAIDDSKVIIDNTNYKSIEEYIIYYQNEIMTFISNYNSSYEKM